MPAVSAADLAAIAELQAQASKNLDRISKNLADHIAAEGKKIGDAHGRTYAKAAKEQIDEHAKTIGFDLQRANELVRELRLQMKPLVVRNTKYFELDRVIELARRSGERTVDIEVLLNIINAPVAPDDKERQP
jgi:hypothetical protein